jgi:hypothetical protein
VAAAHAGAQPSIFSKIGSALAGFNPIARLEKHGDMEKESQTCERKFRFQQQKMFSSTVSIADNDQHSLVADR